MMRFGVVPREELDKVDFSLPADHPANDEVLSGTPAGDLQILTGCPSWKEDSWVGKIYPYSMKEGEALEHYTRQFNTIELNVTHYAIPTDATIAAWREAATPGFTYCPKFPQIISHKLELLNSEDITRDFCGQMLKLGEYLGMPFLQMGPGFNPQKGKSLLQYLDRLPFTVAVELRHPGWFEPKIWNRTCEVLRERGHGLVITDVPGRRDAAHMSLTMPTAMIRFLGNDLHPTDYTRADEWVQRIRVWRDKGLEKLYLFIHCHSTIDAPELARYWIEQLNETLKMRLKPPVFLPKNDQLSMF